MTALDYKSAAEMLRFCADAIIRNKPFLTEVDAKIGDGDHGIGMALGMTNAKNALQAMTDCRDIYKIFSKFGTTMIMSMGGASGVIFGTMFMGGAKGKEPADSIHSKEFANMMKDSLSAIKARGKAEVGDKTMVDALEPAVDAMLTYGGNNFSEMFSLAEAAAKRGVEQTKQLTAKYGRAKFLGKRSLGFPDAGATSVWIIFRAMREFSELQ